MRMIYEIYAEKYYENISEKLTLNVKIRNQSNKYRVRNKTFLDVLHPPLVQGFLKFPQNTQHKINNFPLKRTEST